MHRRVVFLCTALSVFALAHSSAHAQGRRERRRDQAELRDDHRDLARFNSLTQQFDQAVNARDAGAVRSVLRDFVREGRREVSELQREVERAQREFERARGRRARRDDRRDYAGELVRLQQATALVNQLEQAARAEYRWGPDMQTLNQARTAMAQFVALAQQELQASMEESREDAARR